MSSQNNKDEFLGSLKDGDMIVFRNQTSTLWAIYIGDNKVVHLTGETELSRDISDQNECLFTVDGIEFTKASIKKEDLFTVARQFTTYEKNSKDKELIPHDTKEIVDLAKLMVGNIYYDDMWSNCEKFALYCRYHPEQSKSSTRSNLIIKGDLWWGLSAKGRDYINKNNKEVQTRLEDGDLVTFARPLYKHWAVYIGEGKVIHLSGRVPIMQTMKLEHISKLFGDLFSIAKVKEDYFHELAKDCKTEINNKKDDKLKPKKPKEIIKTAEDMLDKEGYNIFWYNCEHFATKCRYGSSFSDQVKKACWILVGAVLVVLSMAAAYMFSQYEQK